MRRVVVTGLGVLTGLGVGTDFVWNRLISGASGISAITKFDTEQFSSKIAGQIPRGDGEGEFNPETVFPAKELRRMDDFIVYGVAAANEALKDSGWVAETEEDALRTGVLTGSGIGGLQTITENTILLKEQGARRVSPFLIPSLIINMLSGQISVKYGFRGPNHAVVTACATGTHAVGDAYRLIALGDADVMVTGSAENAVCPIAFAGFCQARALSTHYNDAPQKACRPWDKGHDGFIMAEGAGALVLEEYEHAKKRGAKIYAEVAGYGLSGDAHHMTAPRPDGSGAAYAVEQAMKHAGIAPREIDYINAHGTSTGAGDAAELLAVRRAFGDHAYKLAMSSTKSATGHALGAAGAMEAVFCCKAIQTGVLPPTINLEDPIDEAAGMNLVANEAQERKVKTVMSNSFGFGGTNASLIFRAV